MTSAPSTLTGPRPRAQATAAPASAAPTASPASAAISIGSPQAAAIFDGSLATTRVQWSRQGQEALDRSYGRVTCDDPAAFRSRGVKWTFGDVILTDTVQSPCSIAPTHDDSSGDSDYVSAVFVMTGGYRVDDNGRHLQFGKGSAGWMPGWTRVAAENLHTSRLTGISVPRSSLAGADRRHRPFGLFEGPMMLTAPALSFVLELMHATDDRSLRSGGGQTASGTPQGHPAAAVLTQLVAGLFIEQAGYSLDAADFGSGLWAKAAAVIDREFADPLLDPGSLARRLHVSLRHLQRAFSQNGSTISDAIRERRAEAVVATMTGGTSPYLSLGEVALMNGFSSIKEMRHALRSKHGMTPREFRSTSLAAAG